MDDDFEDSDFLNEVDITSKIRAPGEYKYYYIGENNSESDKSFLVISTMWHSKKKIENMKLIASTYNSRNVAQLFSDEKLKLYKIYVYKNIIDNKNGNMSLKLAHIIQISPLNRSQYTSSSERENEKPINIRIFFASNNYIILNEVDYRIILIDIITGKFSTLFYRIPDDRSSIYNVFDTYDETYLSDNEIKIRTYVFISIKNCERKTPFYFCRYFIVQKGSLEEKMLDLYSINFNLGVAEPLGLKVVRIRHRFIINGEEDFKSFFILCFISSDRLFQLVTDYDNINLHKKLKRIGPYIKSAIFKKENAGYNEDNSINNDSGLVNIGKMKVWFCLSRIELVKNQICQNMKISLNLNIKKVCAFTLYFETKSVVSYFFNYLDKPEEIKNKIFRNSAENIKIEAMKFDSNFPNNATIYKFLDYSLFKDNCFFGFSNKNLIIAQNNIIHIYDEDSELPVYTYQFFEENLSSLIILSELGSVFLLTEDKLFKVIYNSRYKIFSNDKIFTEDNHIHIYKSKKINLNEKINYPIFEYKPEDIWNSYRRILGIEPEKFTEFAVQNSDSDEEEILIYNKPKVENNNNYWDNIMNENQNNTKETNTKNNIDKKNCVICGKESKLCCNDCKMRYYCSKEHFSYDYVSYHFFECQLFQFFKRNDIMNSKFPQVRYKILYNEFIKTCGRILSFIFKRIITNKDYLDYLEMLITLIQIMDNFGFYENLKEFCNTCLSASSNDKKKSESEKIIFYQEAIFFYLQLNLMKCTFALRGGLYNLTDCYIKIIKNDMISKLTQRYNKRMPLLKCGQNIIYSNKYFQEFNFPLFFDLKKYVKFLGKYNYFDIIEEYISKQLMNLSILTKFKLKLKSKIEVQNTFVSIDILFDDHFGDNYSYKNIILYAFFSTTFYMVEIGKITQTVKLLKRILNNLDFDTLLYSIVSFNLGLLQYALGRFELGVHNMEIAYKSMYEKQFSEKLILRVIDSLGLAYLNQKDLFKSYILFRTSIKQRKQLNKQKYNIKCNPINVYLNYIIDLYEYNFISKTRFLVKKKYKNYDKHQLLKFVLGEMDEEVISEQNLSQLIKAVEFIYNLPSNVLTQLNTDNPPKAPNSIREDFHHEKTFSFNSDVSQTSTFIYKEGGGDNNEFSDEYEEDIEVKPNVYDYLFSRQQQQDFKKLKSLYFKRDIILRDSLGEIEQFNINYDPVYAMEFLKIIEKLKSDFLLKEIFYCFQNEKWRDELYNYNQNNILFGLSKYLKLEKIKNMIAIEKSKNVEKKNIKNVIKNSITVANRNYLSDSDDEDNKKDFENINKNEEIQLIISNKNDENIQNDNKNIKYNYPIFKKKFLEGLKEIEKDKKNEDLYEFLTFDEDYLINLYKNVYLNNPDGNFILKNPLLILNYVYIDVDKKSMFEKKYLKSYSILNESSEKNLSKINNSDIFSKRDSNESKESKQSKSSVTFSNGFRKTRSKNSKNVSVRSNVINSNSVSSYDSKEENISPSASSGTSSSHSTEKSAKFSFFDYEDGTIKIISCEAEYMYICFKKRKTEKNFMDISTKKTPKNMHEFALSFYQKDDKKNNSVRKSKRTFIDDIDNYVNFSKNHDLISKKDNSIENEKTYTVIQKNNLMDNIKKKQKSKTKSKKKSKVKKQKKTKKRNRNLENIISTINKKNTKNTIHLTKKDEESMYAEIFKQLKEKDNNNNLKNIYSPENKNKIKNDYNFKSKEAKERELEMGAINYLKNNMDKKLFANIGMDIEGRNEKSKNKIQNTKNKKKNNNSTSITSTEFLPSTKEMEMNSALIDDYIYSKNFKKNIEKIMGKKENINNKNSRNSIEKKSNKTINDNKYKGENGFMREKYKFRDNSVCSCTCGGGQECAYHHFNYKKPKKYTCNFKICPKNNKNNY